MGVCQECVQKFTDTDIKPHFAISLSAKKKVNTLIMICLFPVSYFSIEPQHVRRMEYYILIPKYINPL